MKTTDFESHRIQGFAAKGAVDVPLISHVEGNLWQGGCIGGVLLPEDITHVISLYKWEQYKLHPHQERREITMYDHDAMPDIPQLHQLADLVNTLRDIPGSQVLVHCQAGLNRSGLVTGLSLIKRGMEPQAAINLLRAKRCAMVLCNDVFERWLTTASAICPAQVDEQTAPLFSKDQAA